MQESGSSGCKKATEGLESSSSNGIMAAPGTSGSVSVSLHPLVIMNISEHWTRTKAQMGRPEKIFGALIGKKKGRNVEVMNSFELDYTPVEGKVIIDRDYYNIKKEQFKQVFSEMDFLGWYSTGERPEDEDVDGHKQILDIHESPLFLQMNPGAKNLNNIPLSLYESIIDIVGGEARMLFIKLSYELATEDSERIGLDHVARISSTNEATQSKVSENLMVQHSAIKMLASRIDIILEYVRAVQNNELPFNHEILREAKALADRLPILESNERFSPEFYTQCNDVALMTLMGTIHKSCNDLVQFVNKFNVLHQRQASGGRRMRGIFF